MEMTSPTSNRFGIGTLVFMSMAAGLISAIVLVAAPFVPPKENLLSGVVLLSFALGWALLAVASVKFSNQPQRWAVVPAIFFGLAGLIELTGPASLRGAFVFVWPLVLLAIVAWAWV